MDANQNILCYVGQHKADASCFSFFNWRLRWLARHKG